MRLPTWLSLVLVSFFLSFLMTIAFESYNIVFSLALSLQTLHWLTVCLNSSYFTFTLVRKSQYSGRDPSPVQYSRPVQFKLKGKPVLLPWIVLPEHFTLQTVGFVEDSKSWDFIPLVSLGLKQWNYENPIDDLV